MNIGEANAVNTVLRHALLIPHPGGEPVSEDDARAAAGLLADKANKALGAGLTSREVDMAWGPAARARRVGVS